MSAYWLFSTRRLLVQIEAHELRGEWLALMELGGRVVGQFNRKVWS